MKKLIAIFATLLLTVGVAGATDYSMTGSYHVGGYYEDNLAGTAKGTDYQMYYEHELSVDNTWQISDTTKVFSRVEMRDETFGTLGQGENNNVGTSPDDNIVIEQVWGAHTFGNGGTLTGGLMSAGAWATSFQDNGNEAYRLKWSQPTAMGSVIGILEKHKESNAADDDKNDQDKYILGVVTKVGSINVLPLFVYVDFQDDLDTAPDGRAIACHVAITGDMGNFGFESEFGVKDTDYNVGTTSVDSTTFGAYVNVWTTMDALKLGILGAYGSFDDDANAGHDFGDDFAAGGALIMGDDITFGSSGNDLDAGRLIAVYGTFTASDALTLNGYLGYAVSGFDAVVGTTDWDGASVWEISMTGKYAITDAVSYGFGAGYAQLEYDNTMADPDAAIEIYHNITFSF